MTMGYDKRMNPLPDLLYRNQGACLTPELIAGLLLGYDRAMGESLLVSVPRVPLTQPTPGDPRLLVNDHNRVGAWVAARVGRLASWGEFKAIGLLDASGELTAGVVLHENTRTNANIHVAFANRYSLKRVFLFAVFDYAFRQAGLTRLTALVSADNDASLTFCQHLGFEPEGVSRRAGDAGEDVIQLVMWATKCQWLGVNNGR